MTGASLLQSLQPELGRAVAREQEAKVPQVLFALVASNEEVETGTCWVQMKMDKVKNKQQSDEGYFWTRRGGDLRMSSSIDWEVPDISKPPSWTWPNENAEQMRHSPLIDDQKNIYLFTTTKLRKFSPDGDLLWTFAQDREANTSPALHDGVVYVLCGSRQHTTIVHAVDKETGKQIWKKEYPGRSYTGDSQTLMVANDTLILPQSVHNPGGNNAMMAISTKDGSFLWDYVGDELIWNFSPAYPGDETLVVGSGCGTVYRIAFGGKLLWKAGVQSGSPIFCGTGGAALGPNGVIYHEYNTLDDNSLQAALGIIKGNTSGITGHLAAYRLSDGQKLWQKEFGPRYLGMQYPSVGRLGPSGPLAVVVAVGENPGTPVVMEKEERARYLADPEYRKKMGVPTFVNAVVALDAESGDQLWRFEEEPWNHFGAAGDEERVPEFKDSIENPICLPDLQGIPVINSYDGTVYAASAHAGNLTAIRDLNGDGIIQESETKVFSPGIAFLNSPSWAPGMGVVAPCWGPMYVFKS
ncbi:unnamed protein product [Effrenium voratum]|nr:unnamed protein product [Effrenium voratum]